MSAQTWVGVLMPRAEADRYFEAPGTKLYLRSHRHVWRFSGTHLSPNGRTSPTYDCLTCGDVCFDPDQGYGGIDPDTGRPMPDTRKPEEAPRD